MARVDPYVNFNGNTEEAFNFYQSVFGGGFIVLQRFKDAPGFGNIPPADQDKIMHIAMPLGGGNVLMGTDMLESMGQQLVAGNNFSISINADSKEEADKLYHGLSEGGTVQVPLGDTFWGAYFGMFTDKFGLHWMINYDYPKA